MEIKDVEKLAELAKIELTEEEKRSLQKDMDSILGYVDQIKKAEVEDIAINYENRNIWREDQIESRDFDHDLIMKQFPDSQDGFVKVKKIL